MNTPICATMREEAAVALLRDEPMPYEVLVHQDTCAACREEYDRLVTLPALMSVMLDDSVPAVEVPDEALLRRTLAEMGHRKRRRRFSVTAIAIAATLVVGVPAGVYAAGVGDTGGGTSVVQPGDVLVAQGTAQDRKTPIGADVSVLGHGEGMGSIVVVTPWGLEAGLTCRIELVDSSGWTHPVKTWTVPEGFEKGWQARVSVTVAPKEVRDVQLVDDDTGSVLLTVPLKKV